jgi:hypothetical protein
VVDIVTTEGERRVLRNLQAKARAADKMFDRLVHFMDVGSRVVQNGQFHKAEEIPTWL